MASADDWIAASAFGLLAMTAGSGPSSLRGASATKQSRKAVRLASADDWIAASAFRPPRNDGGVRSLVIARSVSDEAIQKNVRWRANPVRSTGLPRRAFALLAMTAGSGLSSLRGASATKQSRKAVRSASADDWIAASAFGLLAMTVVKPRHLVTLNRPPAPRHCEERQRRSNPEKRCVCLSE